jgi:serine protease Do
VPEVKKLLAVAGLVIWFASPELQAADGDRIAFAPGRGGSYLGIGVAEIDSGRAKALALAEGRGVEITRVEQDGPAAKAGLKVGDVILDFNAQRVEGTEQFMRLVRETPGGREEKILISRSGVQQTVVLRTGARKGLTLPVGEGVQLVLPRGELFAPDAPDLQMPDIAKSYMGWRSPALGIEGESLQSQLARFFGVEQGVLVRSVLSGTAAERSGIRAGDVILRVNEQPISTPREISSALRAAVAAGRKTTTAALMRDRKELSVNVTLEEEKAEQVRTRKGAPTRL